MADTTFTAGTVIASDWLNDVNDITYGLPDTASGKGASLVAAKAPNSGAVDRNVQQRLDNEFHIADYGGAPGNTDAQNRAALQAMISAMNLAGGGVGYVPYNIDWGYVDRDVTTLPNYTGVTSPICIRDFSKGSSYPGYPDAYDGAQEKRLLYTPQPYATLTFTTSLASGATSATLSTPWTRLSGLWEVTFSNADKRVVNFTNGATTATWSVPLSSSATASFTFVNYGQHNGNYFIVRGDWPPGFQVFNDANYGAPGSVNRTAFDNRRAHFAVGVKGYATWQVGQGVKIGPNVTDEEMSDFIIEKLAVPGDTRGDHAVLVVERKTCNASYGGGRTIPNAVHHFERGQATSPTIAMFEDTGATTTMRFRVAGSSSGDMDLSNISGNLVVTVPSVGNALTVRRDTRNILIGTDSDDASAIVNVASVSKGFLPPRMTTAQRDAITSPAEGLVIYNTTTKVLNFYNGTAWGPV
jgi:hypothetical protein